MPDIELLSIRFGRDRGRMPPIGPLMLGASLDRHGFSWDLTDTQFDERLHPFAVGRLAEIIGRTSAPAIGFSVFNDAVPLVIATLNTCPEMLAGRRVFMGGPGVVGVADRILKQCPAVEAVVVGEGETALPALLRSVPGHLTMAGVYNRQGLQLLVRDDSTPREALDGLPPPPWAWCAGRGYDTISLSTMRGCPYRCDFCEITAFMGRRVSVLSVPNAISCLEAALEVIPTRNVCILDDTFTLIRQRVLSFCEQIVRRRLSISFSVFARADTLDDEILSSLTRAGCSRLFIGMDAADDRLLKAMSKGLTVSASVSSIVRAASYCDVVASFIWGHPEESVDAFDATVDLASELANISGSHRINPQLHLLSPSAKTTLFNRHGEDLILDESAWSMVLGGPVSRMRDRDSESVMALVRSDPTLCAPLYRYRTPAFEYKQSRVNSLKSGLELRLAVAAVEVLRSDLKEMQDV